MYMHQVLRHEAQCLDVCGHRPLEQGTGMATTTASTRHRHGLLNVDDVDGGCDCDFCGSRVVSCGER